MRHGDGRACESRRRAPASRGEQPRSRRGAGPPRCCPGRPTRGCARSPGTRAGWPCASVATSPGPSPSCAAPSGWPPAAATPTGRPTSGPRSASRWRWPAAPRRASPSWTARPRRPRTRRWRAKVLMRRGYVLSAIVGGTTTLSPTTRGHSRACAGRATGSGRRAPSTTSPGCTSSWDASNPPRPRRSRRNAILTAEGLEAPRRPRPSATAGQRRTTVATCPPSLRLYDEAAARFAALGLDGGRAGGGPVARPCSPQAWPPRLPRSPRRAPRARSPRHRSARPTCTGGGPRRCWRRATPEAALAAARLARGAYRRHGRDWFALRAELTELRAREAGGRSGRGAGAAAVVRRQPPGGRGCRRGRSGLAAGRPALARRRDPRATHGGRSPHPPAAAGARQRLAGARARA